jgi:hypothetical protein
VGYTIAWSGKWLVTVYSNPEDNAVQLYHPENLSIGKRSLLLPCVIYNNHTVCVYVCV